MRKKCQKHGHSLKNEFRKGYMKPSQGYRGVADSVTCRRDVCNRFFCGFKGDWEEFRRDTIHSLTMDSEDMEQLNHCGVLWTSHYVRPKRKESAL